VVPTLFCLWREVIPPAETHEFVRAEESECQCIGTDAKRWRRGGAAEQVRRQIEKNKATLDDLNKR